MTTATSADEEKGASAGVINDFNVAGVFNDFNVNKKMVLNFKFYSMVL